MGRFWGNCGLLSAQTSLAAYSVLSLGDISGTPPLAMSSDLAGKLAGGAGRGAGLSGWVCFALSGCDGLSAYFTYIAYSAGGCHLRWEPKLLRLGDVAKAGALIATNFLSARLLGKRISHNNKSATLENRIFILSRCL